MEKNKGAKIVWKHKKFYGSYYFWWELVQFLCSVSDEFKELAQFVCSVFQMSLKN